MGYQMGIGNTIDPTAQIADNVVLGNFNQIGKNVVISGFKGGAAGQIVLGDCNVIHDNTRILMGPEGLTVGDWNVFHNSMLVMGSMRMEIGHNCWFGQNTILDSAGGLFIGNGVRVGMYSQIWTHVASGELIEGCTLFAHRTTRIEDNVWLVGSCSVSPGLVLGSRAICLNGALVTKNVEPNQVVRGAPAKLVEGANYYRDVAPEEKLAMMLKWVQDFADQSDADIVVDFSPAAQEIRFGAPGSEDTVLIGFGQGDRPLPERTTYFDLTAKTYTKRLTELERKFYRTIFDHKARFIPVGQV